jgi:hypothetical protein
MPRKSNELNSQTGELDPKNTVQSLATGFRALQAFTAQDPAISLGEARRAGVDTGRGMSARTPGDARLSQTPCDEAGIV